MTTKTIFIVQGEDAVSRDRDTVIATILGSCISVCLWDPVAMERLINKLVRIGAERVRLRAKLFGGSSMLMGMTDIGERNVQFAETYLSNETIPCDRGSVCGTQARKLRFWPATGAVKQKFVDDAPTLAPPVRISANDVELF